MKSTKTGTRELKRVLQGRQYRRLPAVSNPSQLLIRYALMRQPAAVAGLPRRAGKCQHRARQFITGMALLKFDPPPSSPWRGHIARRSPKPPCSYYLSRLVAVPTTAPQDVSPLCAPSLLLVNLWLVRTTSDRWRGSRGFPVSQGG